MPTPQDREAARRARRPVEVALLLLVLVVVALVAVGALAAWRIYTKANQRFINQAGPFFAVSEDLSVEMLNEETGVRGYVITGDPSTLAPYNQGKKYVKLELGLIAKDQSFDPKIPADLKAMRREVASLQSFFDDEIALVRSGQAGKRRAQARILVGKAHFDHLRAASGALIADAGSVIKHSHREQRSTLINWFVFLGAAGLAALGIAVGLLLRVPRRLYQLFREERFARRQAEEAGDAARALAHVGDAVVLLDTRGSLRYWNPIAGDLFGLERGDERSDSLDGTLAEFVGAGMAPRPVKLAGGQRWLTCADSTFEDGRLLVFRDVTDEQRLERLRSDLVATAAHELRTPLAAVYGAVRTLRHQGQPLTPEMSARFLEMIESESERLRIVMDQLLVSAQLDSSDLRLDRQPVDVGQLCESIVASVNTGKPLDIELDVEQPETDVVFEADPDRLRQVVANLVDNAIKYSPGGGRIELRIAANGDTGTLAISDHGLGIPVEEQDRIFERFYRLDPAMTRGIGGSGLGLYISRQLVQQMGGTLTVNSQHGTGSTFTITLPLIGSRAQPLVARGVDEASAGQTVL